MTKKPRNTSILEMSMLDQFKPRTIPVWRMTLSAYVFPHLELKQQTSTQKEMIDMCKALKSELSDLEIYIYSKGEYCEELNDDWNTCISIKEKGKEKKYTYIIRSCDTFNKTFGCPFIKTTKLGNSVDGGISGLRKNENEKLFNTVESKLMKIMPESKIVDYFDT